MKYIVFICRTIKILISNWPRTRKFNRSLQAGKTVAFDFSPSSRVGHTLRPIFMLWLVKIWQVSSYGKFMQYLETVYFDSWSWQCFVSTCDVFNCFFFSWIYKIKFSWSRVFCYSWLVCLLGFWFRNTSLVKLGNSISNGIVFVFHVAWCVSGLKSLKRF